MCKQAIGPSEVPRARSEHAATSKELLKLQQQQLNVACSLHLWILNCLFPFLAGALAFPHKVRKQDFSDWIVEKMWRKKKNKLIKNTKQVVGLLHIHRGDLHVLKRTFWRTMLQFSGLLNQPCAVLCILQASWHHLCGCNTSAVTATYTRHQWKGSLEFQHHWETPELSNMYCNHMNWRAETLPRHSTTLNAVV